jgi:hypothetical protein
VYEQSLLKDEGIAAQLILLADFIHPVVTCLMNWLD